MKQCCFSVFSVVKQCILLYALFGIPVARL